VLLLAMMAALAGVVLFSIFYQPSQEVPVETLRPEYVAPLVASPTAAFPGTLSWGALYQLGEALPSPPGWEIRYNATVALARHGSPKVRLEVLREMLDEPRQMRNFRSTLADGREVPDEAAARRTVLGALKAVREWHRHPDAVKAIGSDDPRLQMVHAAVGLLTQSPNEAVREEAEATRQASWKS
jgi:hypothetical protein